MGPANFPYGFCPTCGAAGMSRERRPNGNDRCLKGHTYPSCNALHTYVPPHPLQCERPEPAYGISPALQALAPYVQAKDQVTAIRKVVDGFRSYAGGVNSAQAMSEIISILA